MGKLWVSYGKYWVNYGLSMGKLWVIRPCIVFIQPANLFIDKYNFGILLTILNNIGLEIKDLTIAKINVSSNLFFRCETAKLQMFCSAMSAC